MITKIIYKLVKKLEYNEALEPTVSLSRKLFAQFSRQALCYAPGTKPVAQLNDGVDASRRAIGAADESSSVCPAQGAGHPAVGVDGPRP